MSSPKRWVQVKALKYDGRLHRSWKAELVRREDSLLVLDGEFDVDVEHDLLGSIPKGTHSLEYYWFDRWYSVFRFTGTNGEVRNYYCNVNVPPTFENETLSYVDLDLDVLVQPDFSYQVLDVEDFEHNAQVLGYSAEVVINARMAVDELIDMIQSQAFPFNS